jgi:competence protein CoiA
MFWATGPIVNSTTKQFLMIGPRNARSQTCIISNMTLAAAEHRGNRLFIERYPARPWHRWVHGFHMGSMWLYHPERQALYSGTMKSRLIEVKDKEWPTGGSFEDGEWQTDYDSAAGYSYYSKRWRELTLQGPYQPDELKFTVHRRGAATMHSYSWPACLYGTFQVK